jgi:hypothetical protein
MKRKWYQIAWAAVVLIAAGVPSAAFASPFGWGKFGADVPFGSATSLAIDLGGDVTIALTPSGGNFSGTNSHTVTVTTTDVVGYTLYAHPTGSSSMTNGSDSITASGNSSATSLALGTWGYNTTGSTSNFLGMGSIVELKQGDGPFKNGDATTITYGAYVPGSQTAGTYTLAMTYTAVARSQ